MKNNHKEIAEQSFIIKMKAEIPAKQSSLAPEITQCENPSDT